MRKDIIKNDWYEKLLVDLRKLEFTGIVLTKWNQGKRILEDELKFQKPEYGSKRIENIAKDLNVSSREIYRCLQFVKQYPKIDTVRQSLSWRQVIKQLQESRPKPETPELPEGKFQVIFADPPWQFENSGFNQSAASIYPTMPTKEIADLPLKEKIEENAVLFLWATNAMIEDALEVMKNWGFEYKSNIVWIKDKAPGMGWFTKSKHELLLIGVNGEGLHPEYKPQSWIKENRTKHSKKPEIFYEIIEKMYPNQKYIELFARNKRNKWQSWGNEIK